MTLKMQWMRWWIRFKREHPFWQALVITATLSVPLCTISLLFGLGNKLEALELRSWVQKEDLWKVFYDVCVIAPIQEEITYRGPGYVALLLCLGIGAILKKRHKEGINEFQIPIWWKLTLTDLIVWPLIIAPTIYWALLHPYPLPIFVGGIIWGWLMVKTRNIAYNIALHSSVNAIALIGMNLSFNILYLGHLS
ncbi:MAG: CPBP family intramembrane metalloprotease [bacterium]|nr:CPBP family intramembrane metalloprotease [bacterium]